MPPIPNHHRCRRPSGTPPDWPSRRSTGTGHGRLDTAGQDSIAMTVTVIAPTSFLVLISPLPGLSPACRLAVTLVELSGQPQGRSAQLPRADSRRPPGTGLPPLQWSRVVGFRAAQPIGAQHGKTWVSIRVSPQGLGPGRGRPTDRRGRPGAGHQWPVDLQLAPPRPHRPRPGTWPDQRREGRAGRGKRRIAELEPELHATRRAMELVREVVPPKGGTRRSR
jgi:hypothetical protein